MTMEDVKMHFWTSKKAREMAESDWKENCNMFENVQLLNGQTEQRMVRVEVKRHRNYAKLDTGEIVRYDFASKTMEHGVAFDDLVYIGTGAIHHSEVM